MEILTRQERITLSSSILLPESKNHTRLNFKNLIHLIFSGVAVCVAVLCAVYVSIILCLLLQKKFVKSDLLNNTIEIFKIFAYD